MSLSTRMLGFPSTDIPALLGSELRTNEKGRKRFAQAIALEYGQALSKLRPRTLYARASAGGVEDEFIARVDVPVAQVYALRALRVRFNEAFADLWQYEQSLPEGTVPGSLEIRSYVDPKSRVYFFIISQLYLIPTRGATVAQ